MYSSKATIKQLHSICKSLPIVQKKEVYNSSQLFKHQLNYTVYQDTIRLRNGDKINKKSFAKLFLEQKYIRNAEHTLNKLRQAKIYKALKTTVQQNNQEIQQIQYDHRKFEEQTNFVLDSIKHQVSTKQQQQIVTIKQSEYELIFLLNNIQTNNQPQINEKQIQTDYQLGQTYQQQFKTNQQQDSPIKNWKQQINYQFKTNQNQWKQQQSLSIIKQNQTQLTSFIQQGINWSQNQTHSYQIDNHSKYKVNQQTQFKEIIQQEKLVALKSQNKQKSFNKSNKILKKITIHPRTQKFSKIIQRFYTKSRQALHEQYKQKISFNEQNKLGTSLATVTKSSSKTSLVQKQTDKFITQIKSNRINTKNNPQSGKNQYLAFTQ